MSPSIQYASFLIRLWREESADWAKTPADWHIEVEHIQTGESWDFDALDQLLHFLRVQIDEPEERCLQAPE
jgi:hypothetical protein